MTETPLTEATVLTVLRQVLDPEVGMSIVDLGLIYSIGINDSSVRVQMTLTSAGCPMAESIRAGAELALLNHPAISTAQVELVFDPPWHPGMMHASTAA